jgi:hypothetical protein
VGKHEAADGSTVDPLIADALIHRTVDAVHAPRHGGQPLAVRDGQVGWPGEPPVEDGGQGWPQPAPSAAEAQESNDPTRNHGPENGPPAEEAPPPARRRGWRRLLAFSA